MSLTKEIHWVQAPAETQLEYEMSRRRFLGLALGAAALTVAGPAVVPASANAPGYSIRITGNATPYNGFGFPSTPVRNIRIPIEVTCPKGDFQVAMLAGLPGYFSDGRFAAPFMIGNTDPSYWGGTFACTGRPQRGYTLGISWFRNAPLNDPAYRPLDFYPARTRVVVALGWGQPSLATSSKIIQIIVPK